MRDPFPFSPPPQFLQDATLPLARALNLPTLPLHIHEILFAIVLYTFMNSIVAPAISKTFFFQTYRQLDARTRVNWDVHIVSLFQSLLICGLSFWSFYADAERATFSWEERLWGYTGMGGLLAAMAVGYFIWDFFMTIYYIHIFGWGMLAHAVAAAAVFSLGFRPFVNYWAPVFLMYELSTPFNNFHWFMDKLKLTGTVYQWVNGILLMFTFFACRIVWGNYNSVIVFADFYTAYKSGKITSGWSWPHVVTARVKGIHVLDESDVFRFTLGRSLPPWLALSYVIANIVLSGLNMFWMGKMVETIRKRFDPPFGTKGEKAKKEEPSIASGSAADENRPIEVDGSGVRSRRRG